MEIQRIKKTTDILSPFRGHKYFLTIDFDIPEEISEEDLLLLGTFLENIGNVLFNDSPTVLNEVLAKQVHFRAEMGFKRNNPVS